MFNFSRDQRSAVAAVVLGSAVSLASSAFAQPKGPLESATGKLSERLDDATQNYSDPKNLPVSIVLDQLDTMRKSDPNLLSNQQVVSVVGEWVKNTNRLGDLPYLARYIAKLPVEIKALPPWVNEYKSTKLCGQIGMEPELNGTALSLAFSILLSEAEGKQTQTQKVMIEGRATIVQSNGQSTKGEEFLYTFTPTDQGCLMTVPTGINVAKENIDGKKPIQVGIELTWSRYQDDPVEPVESVHLVRNFVITPNGDSTESVSINEDGKLLSPLSNLLITTSENLHRAKFKIERESQKP